MSAAEKDSYSLHSLYGGSLKHIGRSFLYVVNNSLDRAKGAYRG